MVGAGRGHPLAGADRHEHAGRIHGALSAASRPAEFRYTAAMRRTVIPAFLAAAVLVACTPGKGGTADESGTTTTGSTDAPTGDTGPAPTSEGTTEGTDPPSFCAPGPCVTKVDYPCVEFGPCDDPCDDLVPTDCGGPDLCPEVAIKTQGSENYEVVESEADALCVLQALRDRTPGRLRIVWGDPQGFFGDVGVGIHATVSLVGGDVVRMDWDWEYNTCCTATYARIRRVVLQPQAFFDDCLADPTTAKLIACFTAGTEPIDPAPDGWLPPWLVDGACDPGLPDSCGE